MVASLLLVLGLGYPGDSEGLARALSVDKVPKTQEPTDVRTSALVLLSTQDLEAFHATLVRARTLGADVVLAYPPNALIVTLTPVAEAALRQYPAVARVETEAVDEAALQALGPAGIAAHVWNVVFRGLPDPIASTSGPPRPPPEPEGPDLLVPPAQEPGEATVASAPTSTQTSEFMAGTVAVSVVFVESSGGAGYCSPSDAQSENWDAARRATVLTKISEGLAFWTSRSNRPSPLTFVLDDLGTQPTSCEPITRPSSDEGLWTADALTALGFPATPYNYLSKTRSLAHSRRTALGADWAFVIFVVDSLNDVDGMFADGARFAYAYLNGPYVAMTYDNDDWGIDRMDLVTAHETGHIFGALDEYQASCCSTTDTWGYLNVTNTSCNNGGDASDISIMGEGSEQVQPNVDVSTSARGAIGWRNPVPAGDGAVVDVVRTATVSLTPHTDPTVDDTPTYAATAGNTPFPPGGRNTLTTCDGTYGRPSPSPVTISKVAGAYWSVDGGGWTSAGVVADDGAFDEEAESFTFTPPSPVSAGTHTFATRMVNSFGHISDTATDVLTIVATPYRYYLPFLSKQ